MHNTVQQPLAAALRHHAAGVGGLNKCGTIETLTKTRHCLARMRARKAAISFSIPISERRRRFADVPVVAANHAGLK